MLRRSLTISLACFLSLQVQGKHSVNTTEVIEQWEKVIEKLCVNKLVLIQCSIVLISPIPLSAADLYAGLGNKQLYLINNATETCTFCLLTKYCIQAVRRERRHRLIPQLWSSLVYCTNNLLWFRLVSSGVHFINFTALLIFCPFIPKWCMQTYFRTTFWTHALCISSV